MFFAAWPLFLAAVLGRAAGGARRDRGEALRSLYDVCSGKVMALALRLLGDRAEAEDVVQETFLELWRRAAEYDPSRADPATWAAVIGRSRALDRLRARSTAARIAAAQALEPVEDPRPAPAEAREERQRIQAALAALPPEQREVIQLAYFEGLAQSEIAARTGQPLGTVKTRVRLAMEKLGAALGDTR
jgi:RNA polymerase sigma-70 factor (ECF subfamily)